MRSEELKDLLDSAKVVRCHTRFSNRLLVEAQHAEDHIINEISREMSYKMFEYVDLVTFDDPVNQSKIYDAEITTIPSGAWLKIKALLRRHVPLEG